MSTLAERFWSKVDTTGDCWLWTAAIGDKGYGRFQIAKRRLGYAHRVGYELAKGAIPAGLQLDHLCRNRACVNPDHLEPVTPLVNTQRSPIAHGSETHCPDGHEYAGTNLRVGRDGRRYCRTCSNARAKAWHQAHRTA